LYPPGDEDGASPSLAAAITEAADAAATAADAGPSAVTTRGAAVAVALGVEASKELPALVVAVVVAAAEDEEKEEEGLCLSASTVLHRSKRARVR
jgi:hypothetical protein